MLWKTLGLLLMYSKVSVFKRWQTSLKLRRYNCNFSHGWSESKGLIRLHYTKQKYQTNENIQFNADRKLPECIIKKETKTNPRNPMVILIIICNTNIRLQQWEILESHEGEYKSFWITAMHFLQKYTTIISSVIKRSHVFKSPRFPFSRANNVTSTTWEAQRGRTTP